MKKLAIVGIGTIGIVSLLKSLERLLYTKSKDDIPEYFQYLVNDKFSSFDEDIQISIIHNPNIPKVSVGEGCTSIVYNSMCRLFGVKLTTDILKKCNYTRKFFVNFEWEEGLGHNFQIPHTYKDIHFDSMEFTNTVLKEITNKYKFVQMIEGDVNQMNLDYDLVIDCSGFPSKEDLEKDYIIPDIETVNSAIVYQDFKNYNEDYTTSKFHNNGWMFQIPLKNRKTFGYLYNKNITDYNSALEDFKKQLDIIDESKVKSFNWDFYYKKKVIENNTIWLGNKLYLYEPAGAIPIHFYANTLEKILIILMNNNFESSEDIENNINEEYIDEVEKMLNIICLYYSGDVKSDSKFWKETRDKTREHLKKSKSWQSYLTDGGEYWLLDEYMMGCYLNGFKINRENVKR